MFNVSCECCSGDYLLHTNPQDLISHLSTHLFHYLKYSPHPLSHPHTTDPHLSEDDDLDESESGNEANIGERFIDDYRTELTTVHCTSPFDHKSVWFEILPAYVNKDHAAENIIQHIYHPHHHRNHGGGDDDDDDQIDKTNPSTENRQEEPRLQRPAALFAFGNDFNDLPMLKFVKNYPTSSSNQLNQSPLDHIDHSNNDCLTGSFMIETNNNDILRVCRDSDFEIIGKCEESAVGQQLYKIVKEIIRNNP